MSKIDDIKAEVKKTRFAQWAVAQKTRAGYWLQNNPTGQRIEAGYRKASFMAREAYGKLPERVRSGISGGVGMIHEKLLGPKGAFSGTMGKVFMGFSLVEILRAHGIFGKIKETFKQIWLMSVGWELQMAKAFFTGKSFLTSLIRDTGSLEAALQRIAKMQALSHVFAPFLGGLAAGKRRVAEIFALAAKSPFNVDQWARASHAMTVGGHGALGNPQEMKAVGDAAAASGNDVGEVGEIVAEFYATVREGRPVGELAEKMRQMGIVTEGSAESLKALAESGEDATSMARALMGALSVHAGGQKALSGELRQVAKDYDDAKRTMKEQFGAPVTETHIKDMQNYTDAMNAVAPAIGRVSQFFQTLMGLFTNFASGAARWAAQNDALMGGLEALAKVLGIMLVAVSGGALIWLFKLAVQFGVVRNALTLLNGALQMMTGWAGLAVIIALLAEKHFHLTDALFGTAKAAEKEADAHNQAQRAMEAKINAVETLTQKMESLKEATDEYLKLKEAQPALDKAAAKEAEANKTKPAKGALAGGLVGAYAGARIGMFLGPEGAVAGAVIGGIGGALYGGLSSEPDTAAAGKAASAKERTARNEELRKRLIAKGSLVGEAEQRQMENDLATARATEASQMRLREARGENGMKISLQDLEVTKKRASAAQAGVAASAKVEALRAGDETDIQQLRARGASPAEIAAAEARKTDRGLSQGYGSTYAQTMAEKLTAAKEAGNALATPAEQERNRTIAGGMQANPEELAWWRKEAARLKEQEANAPQLTASVADKTADILGKMQPVASYLARVGGGGNASGPLDQVPRDQLAVLRSILATLLGGVGVTPDVPSVPDVSRPGEQRAFFVNGDSAAGPRPL